MIPKIIHKVWEGKSEPLSDFFKEFAQTWKDNYPDWDYEFWGVCLILIFRNFILF